MQPDEDDKQRIPPYLAYSRSGNVSGEVVYANFGRNKDFEYLNQLGISLNGKIAVIRYGQIFRGDKVETAAKYGLSGVILYNDPGETAPFGKYRVYPKEPWLPFDSVQMGSIFTNGGVSNSNSEKLTFGKSYPANFSTYLPSILLSTNNAIEIIKNMKGPEAPKHWRGKLPISYRLGPGLRDDNHIKFEVHSKLVHRSIYNIIATIYGRDEPDRVVLFGNHRDAWQFGGVDPSSGTAVLLEVSRGLSNLRKQGWRPRRTIMLCSWDAEEFGIIGSTMWVKENQKLLTERAVFYLNMDYAVQGNYTLEAQGSSALKELMYDETKKVGDPNSKQEKKNESMFDIWKRRAPSPHNDNMPNWGNLDGTSDFLPFNQLIGEIHTKTRALR